MLNRPPLHEVSQEVRELIQAMNPLDMELYEVCKKKFDAMELKGFFCFPLFMSTKREDYQVFDRLGR